ncbi:uncharacterized protein J5F26_013112 isoform 1-T3 [Ciconia maguari]
MEKVQLDTVVYQPPCRGRCPAARTESLSSSHPVLRTAFVIRTGFCRLTHLTMQAEGILLRVIRKYNLTFKGYSGLYHSSMLQDHMPLKAGDRYARVKVQPGEN